MKLNRLLVALACLWGTALMADNFALLFDGLDDFVRVPDNSAYNFTGGVHR
jgi:hypothetical protein